MCSRVGLWGQQGDESGRDLMKIMFEDAISFDFSEARGDNANRNAALPALLQSAPNSHQIDGWLVRPRLHLWVDNTVGTLELDIWMVPRELIQGDNKRTWNCNSILPHNHPLCLAAVCSATWQRLVPRL
uniref:Uncharacterized protein n=1 Tax=Grammatophora oceanica TaxID=210454 RepID=A0A7S1USR1_9STRA|mmetsp:Transcript_18143/g.26939  ORF Transcript_18143/g.26939 Transcript_18143/m.26939 type:complete len:129 (+) Transcript_18143:457-843(+)